MSEIYFIRGTTPNYTMTFYDEDDVSKEIDTSNFTDVRITLKQFENTLVRKSTLEGTATMNEDGTVSFSLSQDETLRFQPGTAYVQPHIKTSDDEAYSDRNAIKIKVYDILDGGTI